MRMISGKKIYVADIHPDDILVSDFAYGLARSPRFRGQTIGDEVLSVGQHLVMCWKYCPCHRMATLFHDVPEFIYSDVPSPVKEMGLCDGIVEAEDSLMGVLATKYGFRYDREVHDEIKKIDIAMRTAEIRDLTYHNNCVDFSDIDDIEHIVPWNWKKTYCEFINAFRKQYSFDHPGKPIPD